jgi:hypothetical protein
MPREYSWIHGTHYRLPPWKTIWANGNGDEGDGESDERRLYALDAVAGGGEELGGR